jgi:hypothetical protein
MTSCRRLKPQDLTGAWVISKTSRQRFLSADQQDIEAQIVLRANGSFTADHVPAGLVYRDGASVSGTGGWKLIDDGGQRILLEFQTMTEGQQGTLPYGTLLNVASGLSGTTLNYFQGDADLGRRIDFERNW